MGADNKMGEEADVGTCIKGVGAGHNEGGMEDDGRTRTSWGGDGG